MGDGCPRVFADGRGVWRRGGPGQEPWGVWWHDIEAVTGRNVEVATGEHVVIELVHDVEDSMELYDFWPGFGQVVRAISAHLPGIRPGWLQEIRRWEPAHVSLRVWDRAEPGAAADGGA
jgi:hypothetical protein